jgi:hypothetical protein
MTSLLLALALTATTPDTCLEWARTSYQSCAWLARENGRHTEQWLQQCKKERQRRTQVCREQKARNPFP